MKECDGFYLPDGAIGAMTLTHDGSDAWQPEWIRVLLDDNTYLMCYDGEVSSLSILCT